VVEDCHTLLREARNTLQQRFGFTPTCPDSDEWYTQMTAFVLPEEIDGPELQRRLFDEHKVEIPVTAWDGRQLIRVSLQGYNNRSDLERLYSGVEAIVNG